MGLCISMLLLGVGTLWSLDDCILWSVILSSTIFIFVAAILVGLGSSRPGKAIPPFLEKIVVPRNLDVFCDGIATLGRVLALPALIITAAGIYHLVGENFFPGAVTSKMWWMIWVGLAFTLALQLVMMRSVRLLVPMIVIFVMCVCIAGVFAYARIHSPLLDSKLNRGAAQSNVQSAVNEQVVAELNWMANFIASNSYGLIREERIEKIWSYTPPVPPATKGIWTTTALIQPFKRGTRVKIGTPSSLPGHVADYFLGGAQYVVFPDSQKIYSADSPHGWIPNDWLMPESAEKMKKELDREREELQMINDPPAEPLEWEVWLTWEGGDTMEVCTDDTYPEKLIRGGQIWYFYGLCGNATHNRKELNTVKASKKWYPGAVNRPVCVMPDGKSDGRVLVRVVNQNK